MNNENHENTIEKDLLQNPLLKVLSQSVLIAVCDIKGKIIYANDYMKEVSKFPNDELIGQSYSVLNSGYHEAEFFNDMIKSISRGRIWRGEVCNRAKDGSLYWNEVTISPIYDEQNNIASFISVMFPTTKRKEAEQKLKDNTLALEETVRQMEKKEEDLEDIKKATLNILEDLDEEKRVVEKKVEERTLDIEHERNKLLLVTKNMKGGAILFDSQGDVAFVNHKLYELVDLKREIVKPENILDHVFAYFEGTKLQEYLRKCKEGKTFTIAEIEAKGKIFEISFLNLDNKDEESTRGGGQLMSFYDITDIKTLERSKSQLVAVASHQLRTPLTAMRANVEMLVDESYGALNSEQHELLSDIDASTSRLIEMVNDMLDITKIEKGEIDLSFGKVNLREMLDSLASDLKDFAEQKGVSVKIYVPPDLSVYVDKLRVRQVMQNLMDNAIKYSKDPGVLEVSSRVQGNFAQLIFKDNGLGIPEDEQGMIFKRFYRASNTADSNSYGSGLGLHIVRSIVSKLGGDIWFDSEVGVGTTFYVSFPIDEIKTEF